MVRKGKTVESYSIDRIDRIDNNKGYTLENLQILTVSDNSKKRTKQVVYDFENRTFYTASLPDAPPMTDEDCPF